MHSGDSTGNGAHGNSAHHEMPLSLVQKENWTGATEISANDENPSNTSADMVCTRHKGSKVSLLVHMIDGFVIEESNVPFKGAEKEDEVSEVSKPLPTSQDRSQLVAVEDDKENEIVNASMNSYPEDKDELMSLLPTSCKYCGGELPENRAMWGKRFCSISCSKKYSMTCSQRVRRALHRRTSQSNSNTKSKYNLDVESGTIHSPAKRKRGGSRRSVSVTPQKRSPIPQVSTPPKEQKKNPTESIETNYQFSFPLRDPLGYGITKEDIENELYEGVEPLLKYSIVPMIKWSTVEVYSYINSIAGCAPYAKIFKEEEIDGQALLLLKIEHMVHSMNLKLGPALKIASNLRLIKMQYGIEGHSKYLSSPV